MCRDREKKKTRHRTPPGVCSKGAPGQIILVNWHGFRRDSGDGTHLGETRLWPAGHVKRNRHRGVVSDFDLRCAFRREGERDTSYRQTSTSPPSLSLSHSLVAKCRTMCQRSITLGPLGSFSRCRVRSRPAHPNWNKSQNRGSLVPSKDCHLGRLLSSPGLWGGPLSLADQVHPSLLYLYMAGLKVFGWAAKSPR